MYLLTHTICMFTSTPIPTLPPHPQGYINIRTHTNAYTCYKYLHVRILHTYLFISKYTHIYIYTYYIYIYTHPPLSLSLSLAVSTHIY